MLRRLSPWALAILLGSPGCRSVDLSPSDRAPSGGVSILRSSSAGVDAGSGGLDGAVLDAAAAMPSVRITAPASGASFPQDRLFAGEWAAEVTFTVEARDVARVELVSGGASLGDAVGGALTFRFHAAGAHTVEAIGYDAGGTERARDASSIMVTAPADTRCHAMLHALGLDSAPPGPTRTMRPGGYRAST